MTRNYSPMRELIPVSLFSALGVIGVVGIASKLELSLNPIGSTFFVVGPSDEEISQIYFSNPIYTWHNGAPQGSVPILNGYTTLTKRRGEEGFEELLEKYLDFKN